MAILSCGK